MSIFELLYMGLLDAARLEEEFNEGPRLQMVCIEVLFAVIFQAEQRLSNFEPR